MLIMLDNFFHAHIISLTITKKLSQFIHIRFNSIKSAQLDVLYIIEQSLITKLVVT